jgi:hypothetical protein
MLNIAAPTLPEDMEDGYRIDDFDSDVNVTSEEERYLIDDISDIESIPEVDDEGLSDATVNDIEASDNSSASDSQSEEVDLAEAHEQVVYYCGDGWSTDDEDEDMDMYFNGLLQGRTLRSTVTPAVETRSALLATHAPVSYLNRSSDQLDDDKKRKAITKPTSTKRHKPEAEPVPLALDELVDTSRFPRANSVDVEDPSLSRWTRIPIGTFRMHRRNSLPAMRSLENAVRSDMVIGAEVSLLANTHYGMHAFTPQNVKPVGMMDQLMPPSAIASPLHSPLFGEACEPSPPSSFTLDAPF